MDQRIKLTLQNGGKHMELKWQEYPYSSINYYKIQIELAQGINIRRWVNANIENQHYKIG